MEFLPGPFPACKSKNSLHYIKDCQEIRDAEKGKMGADIAAKKVETGPHSNTRSEAN